MSIVMIMIGVGDIGIWFEISVRVIVRIRVRDIVRIRVRVSETVNKISSTNGICGRAMFQTSSYDKS